MQEELEVARANENFYRAFESLDIKEMEKVWAKDCEIQCGHPGWRILRGWEPVMESWRRIFENTPSMRFMLTDVSIDVRGGFAWVTCLPVRRCAATPLWNGAHAVPPGREAEQPEQAAIVGEMLA